MARHHPLIGRRNGGSARAQVNYATGTDFVIITGPAGAGSIRYSTNGGSSWTALNPATDLPHNTGAKAVLIAVEGLPLAFEKPVAPEVPVLALTLAGPLTPGSTVTLTASITGATVSDLTSASLSVGGVAVALSGTGLTRTGVIPAGAAPGAVIAAMVSATAGGQTISDSATGAVVAAGEAVTHNAIVSNRGFWMQGTRAFGATAIQRRGRFVTTQGDVTNLRTVDAGWLVAAGDVVNPLPNSVTFGRYIEYPAGTRHPVTFGGASTATLVNDGVLVSDVVLDVATGLPLVIPAGAAYWESRTAALSCKASFSELLLRAVEIMETAKLSDPSQVRIAGAPILMQTLMDTLLAGTADSEYSRLKDAGFSPVFSSQVSERAARDNTGKGASTVYFGAGDSAFVPTWGSPELIVDPYSESKTGKVALTMFAFLDVLVQRTATHFFKLTQVQDRVVS